MNNDNLFVNYTDNIEVVVSKIILNKSRTVFILKKKKIIGSISEGDILRALLMKKDLKSPATNIMNKSFKLVFEDDLEDIKKIKKIFIKNKIYIMPIVNKKGNFKKFLNFYEIFK